MVVGYDLVKAHRALRSFPLCHRSSIRQNIHRSTMHRDVTKVSPSRPQPPQPPHSTPQERLRIHNMHLNQQPRQPPKVPPPLSPGLHLRRLNRDIRHPYHLPLHRLNNKLLKPTFAPYTARSLVCQNRKNRRLATIATGADCARSGLSPGQGYSSSSDRSSRAPRTGTTLGYNVLKVLPSCSERTRASTGTSGCLATRAFRSHCRLSVGC